MRHNDGDVHDYLRLLQLVVKKCEAVEDVDGQPAEGEQSNDYGEGFCSPDLLLQQAVVMAIPVADSLELNLYHLLSEHNEDLQVNAEHDEQWWQHTDEKVKIDHILHVDDTLKEALELAAL